MIRCSELENSYDVNLITSRVTHCCKYTGRPLLKEEVKQHSWRILDLNKETVKSRQDLANNIQTENCQDCWDVESVGIKSWRQIHNDLELDSDKVKFNVQLSSLCNQSCLYCHNSLSSSIARFEYWVNAETGQRELNTLHKQPQLLTIEHVIDFVANLPVTKKSIVLGFTGGEPFIVDKFNENIEALVRTYFEKDPSRHMTLVFSSNGNVDIENLSNFYTRLKSLKSQYNLKLSIGLSIENLFERAEYIRQGLSWTNFMSNFDIHYKNADEVKLKLTVNAFSIVNITDFVKYFKEYNVSFTYGYTQQAFFRSNILDLSFLKEIQRLEEYLKSSNTEHRFPNYQVLYDTITDDQANAKIFKSAITDLDEIRGTNWRLVFPEYQQWFENIAK
jgi:organic radical activating enzyme